MIVKACSECNSNSTLLKVTSVVSLQSYTITEKGFYGQLIKPPTVTYEKICASCGGTDFVETEIKECAACGILVQKSVVARGYTLCIACATRMGFDGGQNV